ncbi:hypothetical protein [Streptomyces sp. NPDC001635]
MNDCTSDGDDKKRSRRAHLLTRARRLFCLLRRRFLFGVAYGSGTACVSLAVWFVQRRF